MRVVQGRSFTTLAPTGIGKAMRKALPFPGLARG